MIKKERLSSNLYSWRNPTFSGVFCCEIVYDELMNSIIQRKGYFFPLFMLLVPLYDIYEIYRKFDWIYTEILFSAFLRVLPLLRLWLFGDK